VQLETGSPALLLTPHVVGNLAEYFSGPAVVDYEGLAESCAVISIRLRNFLSDFS
jgi:hypothetical protein